MEAGPDAPPVTGEDTTVPVTGDSVVASTLIRASTAPSVRDSGIPLGSILLAVAVVAVAGVGVVVVARRRSETDHRRPAAVATPGQGDASAVVGADGPGGTASAAATTPHESDTVTLNFLLELGHAMIDAGDAVNHVESTLRSVARVNGVDHLGVLVLPSALVLSLQRGGSMSAEVRTSTTTALRLDQIDDVFRLVRDADRGAVTPEEGRRALIAIRSEQRPESFALLVVAFAISTVGLAMLLRGGWLEVLLAAGVGVLIGALTLKMGTLDPSYQAFWPLVAATIASAAAFASARAFDDLTVFPVLVSPLIMFLPGGLLTTGVLELSTGQPVSGSSRLAAGAMRLVLLALGIVAGANLVGVPGGDLRSGGEGVVSAIAPWVGVGLFGAGIAWYNGARVTAQRWILPVLYLAYAAQVLGGLFFGSALSGLFGALAMTPAALIASRQPSGPTPLVTFLPGFWLLVPGALGLEGVTLILGQGAADGTDAVTTALISMVGISLGIMLGLAVFGADASRPWSDVRRRGHRAEQVGQG